MTKNGHSEPDAPPLDINSEGDEPSRQVIDDEHYSHGRRLQSIHNFYDRTLEVRNAVEERLISGRISEFQARRYYRGAVETYIMTILPIIERDDIDLERDYASGVELGEVIIHPPDDLVRAARANVSSIPRGGAVPEPVQKTVVGLRDVLELPSPLTHEFGFALQKGSDVQVYQRKVAEEIPRDVLDRAVQACSNALDDADMGVNLDDGSEEAEFDLSFMPKDGFERTKEGVDDASE